MHGKYISSETNCLFAPDVPSQQNEKLTAGLDVEVPSHLMRPILFDGNTTLI